MGTEYAWNVEQEKKQKEEQALADEKAYVEQELADIRDDDERIAHEEANLDDETE